MHSEVTLAGTSTCIYACSSFYKNKHLNSDISTCGQKFLCLCGNV